MLWDIGANIGLFSIYAALRPDVPVVAFEPAAGSYAALNENLVLNGMDDRISGYPVALAGESRLDVFNMASTVAGTALQGFGTERDQLERPIKTGFRQGAPAKPDTTEGFFSSLLKLWRDPGAPSIRTRHSAIAFAASGDLKCQ